jgi:hypothetical protein
MEIINSIPVLNQVSNSYSKLDYIFHFLGLNPQYDILDVIASGDLITVDKYVINEPVVVTTIATASSTFDLFVRSDQNIFDICTRFYGNLSNIVTFFTQLGIETINTPIGNSTITVKNPSLYNPIVQYYNANGSILSTEIPYQKIIVGSKSFNISFNISWN